MGVNGVDDAAAVRVRGGGIERLDGFDAQQEEGHEDDVEPLGGEHQRPEWRTWDLRFDARGEAEVARDHDEFSYGWVWLADGQLRRASNQPASTTSRMRVSRKLKGGVSPIR
jgi:hypothetical protein